MGENMSIEIPIDIVGLVEMVIGQTVTLIGRVILRLGLRGRYDLLVGVTRTGREADADCGCTSDVQKHRLDRHFSCLHNPVSINKLCNDAAKIQKNQYRTAKTRKLFGVIVFFFVILPP